jgi:hypothetical protein
MSEVDDPIRLCGVMGSSCAATTDVRDLYRYSADVQVRNALACEACSVSNERPQERGQERPSII